MTTPVAKLLHLDSVHWTLESRAALRLTGADVRDWLQGQVTQDVLQAGVLDACWCTRTGHIEAMSQLIPQRNGSWCVVTDADAMEAVAERVRNHVIMEDVTAEPVTAARWFTVQGPGAAALVERILGPTGESIIEAPNALAWRSDRSIHGGWDVAWFGGELPDLGQPLPAEQAETARIEALRPRWGVDVDRSTLLPEMGPEFVARNVSYRKGCYLGQEVLMRIYSRGHTNWSWRLASTTARLVPGHEVKGPDGKVVGRVTSSAESATHGPIAALRLRREFSDEGTVLDGLTVLGGPLGENE